jgi:hypothetical protein
MNCCDCNCEMEAGFVYVRGFNASLLWSDKASVSAVSRQGVEQIDLSRICVAPSRQQAVVNGFRCPECEGIFFRTKRAAMPFTKAPTVSDTSSLEATETR